MLKRSFGILAVILSVGISLYLTEQVTGRDVLGCCVMVLLVLVYDPYLLVDKR